MPCGPFFMYTFLRIPAVDGTNCAALEAAMLACAIFGLVLAACACADQTPRGMIYVLILVLTAPFFIYIVPAVFLWIMIDRIWQNQKTKQHKIKENNETFMKDVKIEPAEIRKDEKEEEEEKIHPSQPT